MAARTRSASVEWPTVAVGACGYALWMTLVLSWSAIPAIVAVPALALVLAWHGSLQHEAIHGHPFRNRRAGDAFAAPPLALWLPYRVYRETHLTHHRTGRLTDPYDDPETWYVSDARWRQLGGVRRGVLTLNQTLAGRLVVGPLLIGARFARGEFRRIVRRRPGAAGVWARHAVAVAVVVAAVIAAGVPLWQYAVACYLSVSVTLVRSYAEHRAVVGDRTASAVIEAGPLLALLFLNNNLHHTHHARPGAPWYRLPRLARALDSADVAERGAGRYRGYTDVVRRHLLHPLDRPVHPAR